MQDATRRPQHGHINFEGLTNTRDLGGLITSDGQQIIRPHLLLRSGTLYFATPSDLDRLHKTYHLKSVVDLRGDEEVAELPDPMDQLPDAVYVHADVLKDALAGVSQDTKAREQFEALQSGGDDPARFMESLYPQILLADSGIAGYRSFMHALLENTKGAFLWHCYVGRDRCGMASMLVESILGVPTDAMEDDYLATNIYTDVESDERTAANPRFIRAAVSGVQKQFGSIEGYVREALGLDDADLAELRGRYLVPCA